MSLLGLLGAPEPEAKKEPPCAVCGGASPYVAWDHPLCHAHFASWATDPRGTCGAQDPDGSLTVDEAVARFRRAFAEWLGEQKRRAG